ncbi:hypothetical protein N0B31_19170 [Salinirubellus salinus]|uniref:C2H2-type domain-containing protein n=1 Tax=Salinirubellus salinus TaxID=1364945 RepID=A0A9E7U4E9_9EURY|nr:AN1-type zinc finger protein [Salinirubellus salinus]UWM54225.1 hypothetical protein N0B31_19170 [Salinirubellus salinus]
MTGACAACGADDELLFTCRHCERRFCQRHELPHHTCEQFRSGGHTPEPSADESPAESSTRTTAGPTSATRRGDQSPERTPSPEATVAADGPVGTEEPVGPMDSERAVGVVSPASSPRSLGEWLGHQTYLTFLFKIGGLALLLNVAFYGGVALTLYDPFGLL